MPTIDCSDTFLDLLYDIRSLPSYHARFHLDLAAQVLPLKQLAVGRETYHTTYDQAPKRR